MSRAVQAEIGSLVADRYRLVEQIGEGGMGRVYRATDETLSREVAVKILLPQYAVQEQSRQRFIREAKVTATMTHSSIIRIYDFGMRGDCLYLVMELLSGRTLRSLLTERKQMTPAEVVDLALPIADALAHAHEIPLIHRDLKPENIMLSSVGPGFEVKVLDFGMGFIADSEEAAKEGMGRLTKEGMSGGTPTYMSPEQIQGKTVTTAADIYAFGCVLFEALAGEPPFDGPMMKVLTKHMYQPIPDLRRFSPDAPQALVELVERMLLKRAPERPSAETVKTRLGSLTDVVAGSRERSRDRTFLSTRAERMVSAAKVERPDLDEPASELQVAVFGRLDEELALALAASAISTSEMGVFDVGSLNCDVIFVADASIDSDVLSGLAGQCPVVATASSADVDVVSTYLRAGVAEIVITPVSPDELTKKLRRAARKKR